MFIHYQKFTIYLRACPAACGSPCPAGRRPDRGWFSSKGCKTVCALVFGRTSFSQKPRRGQAACPHGRDFPRAGQRAGRPCIRAGHARPAPSRQCRIPLPAAGRKKSRAAYAVLLPISFFAGLHAAFFFRFFRRGWIASRSTRTSAVARLTRSAASHRLGSRKATRISPE